MGVYTIKPLTKALAWLITSVLVYLNIRMVSEQANSYFNQPGHLFWKIFIMAGGISFVALLIITIAYPLLGVRRRGVHVPLHPEASGIKPITAPQYYKIAIALEFSEKDQKLLSYAIGQANKGSSFVLVHVVESVPAKFLEKESDDLETRTDQGQLDFYVSQLEQLGYRAEGILGFNRRNKEIVRIIKEKMQICLLSGRTGIQALKIGSMVKRSTLSAMN